MQQIDIDVAYSGDEYLSLVILSCKIGDPSTNVWTYYFCENIIIYFELV